MIPKEWSRPKLISRGQDRSSGRVESGIVQAKTPLVNFVQAKPPLVDLLH